MIEVGYDPPAIRFWDRVEIFTAPIAERRMIGKRGKFVDGSRYSWTRFISGYVLVLIDGNEENYWCQPHELRKLSLLELMAEAASE